MKGEAQLLTAPFDKKKKDKHSRSESSFLK